MRISLRPRQDKLARKGYPWIFSNQIETVPDGAESGDVVTLVSTDGDVLGRGLYHSTSQIVLRVLTSDPEVPIDEAFFRTLSRPPTAKEKESLLKVMAEAKDVERRVLLEDLYWGIMSSREFIFNH